MLFFLGPKIAKLYAVESMRKVTFVNTQREEV